jgi:uncharacterized protein (DUF2062 family)
MLEKEQSDHKLAVAVSVGIYIAFCPFQGLHTILIFACAWLLKLNFAVLLATSCLIHNPWTMFPIYAGEYVFGNWLCSSVCGYDMMSLNPSWMSWVNFYITKYTGLNDISLWSFLIGGNIIAIAFSLLVYPLMRYLLSKLALSSLGLSRNRTTVS